MLLTNKIIRHIITELDHAFVPQENRKIKLSYKEAKEMLEYLEYEGLVTLSQSDKNLLETDTKKFIDDNFHDTFKFGLNLSVDRGSYAS